jgi:hypothetical protein
MDEINLDLIHQGSFFVIQMIYSLIKININKNLLNFSIY